MARMGIDLAGCEIDNGALDAAERRLREIYDPDVLPTNDRLKSFVKKKVKHQIQRLNQERVLRGMEVVGIPFGSGERGPTRVSSATSG